MCNANINYSNGVLQASFLLKNFIIVDGEADDLSFTITRDHLREAEAPLVVRMQALVDDLFIKFRKVKWSLLGRCSSV